MTANLSGIPLSIILSIRKPFPFPLYIPGKY